jgi:NAD(P)-dependent dehydrogenase (short-subunit alcohol dehydrogenase family)
MHVDAFDQFKVHDRVAIVTGASSGLGARFAHVLDAAGAKVVLAARRTERLERLAGELRDALPVSCDVTNDAHVDALVDAAMKQYGQIDILVNAAGDAEAHPAEEEPLEAFRRIVAINLTAAFAVSQRVGRRMLERGRGSIINIASVLGLAGGGIRSLPSYAASKGGLVNLTRELALEWAGRGVRVNAIAPAYFPSEMTQQIFASEKALALIRRMTPMQRPGQSHELDGALLFFASDASSYVTGQVLAVDGGLLAGRTP